MSSTKLWWSTHCFEIWVDSRFDSETLYRELRKPCYNCLRTNTVIFVAATEWKPSLCFDGSRWRRLACQWRTAAAWLRTPFVSLGCTGASAEWPMVPCPHTGLLASLPCPAPSSLCMWSSMEFLPKSTCLWVQSTLSFHWWRGFKYHMIRLFWGCIHPCDVSQTAEAADQSWIKVLNILFEILTVCVVSVSCRVPLHRSPLADAQTTLPPSCLSLTMPRNSFSYPSWTTFLCLSSQSHSGDRRHST